MTTRNNTPKRVKLACPSTERTVTLVLNTRQYAVSPRTVVIAATARNLMPAVPDIAARCARLYKDRQHLRIGWRGNCVSSGRRHWRYLR
jgi:hypothetical protein